MHIVCELAVDLEFLSENNKRSRKQNYRNAKG